jgi:tetratricopeptide (TPR) repeat protein
MRQLCFVILLVPALAWAQSSKSADDWFNEGYNQYTLGNFDKAIESFRHAFELQNDPEKQTLYVYNIAQAYRQSNDCVKASFFYKRTISLATSLPKPVSSKVQAAQTTSERFVRELEECNKTAQELSKRQPDNVEKQNGTNSRREPAKVADSTPDGEGGEADTGTHATSQFGTSPHAFEAWFSGGGTAVATGSKKIPMPVLATFALVAGYPISITPELRLHAGAAFTLLLVPFNKDTADMKATSTGTMTSAMANIGATYDVARRVDLRFDAGFGIMAITGASETAFTANAPTTGALTTFHVRGGLSLDYAMTPNFVLGPSLALSYSPAKEGLDPTITGFTAFDFMVSAGYRL